MSELIWVTLGWLLLVGVGWPAVAILRNSERTEVRAFNLPRGSVRGVLALSIVGSFVVFLVFVPFLSSSANAAIVDKVLVAFGTLSGSVTGFYFGGRASTPSPASRGDDH